MSWILKNLVLMVMVAGIIFTILSVGVYLQYRKEEPEHDRPDFLTREFAEVISSSRVKQVENKEKLPLTVSS